MRCDESSDHCCDAASELQPALVSGTAVSMQAITYVPSARALTRASGGRRALVGSPIP